MAATWFIRFVGKGFAATGRAALFTLCGGRRAAIKTLEERDDILDP